MFKKIRSKKGYVFLMLTVMEASVIGAITLGTMYGAYKTHKGDWGNEGSQAVKNCLGTHVNGNCGHMELKDL